MPIAQTVLDVARTNPNQLAIVGADDRLTYAELAGSSRRTIAVADAAQRERRVEPAPETRGIPITAISTESAFHAARIMAALALHRAVSATIDPRWPLEHRANVIVTTGIGLVLSDDPELPQTLASRSWTGTILTLDEFLVREQNAEPGPPPSVRPADEAFLLLFSSGTTGNPKAFLKTRQQYRDNVAVSAAHLEPGLGVATLAPGPLSYSLTLYAVIECLATGGSVHVADQFDPIALGRRVQDEAITRVVAVPAVVQALADAARRDPDRFATVELIVTGGANLPVAIRDAVATSLPTARLISYYGAAEIGFIGDSRGGDGTRIDVYTTIGAEIRDESGRPVPVGELGTLWIRADACSDGYLAGTTSEVLKGSDGWASVGDLGRIVDGRLELVGRAGDIAITGGHKVALTEVDRAFADAVTSISVALDDARLGSVVALVFEGAGTTKSELQSLGRVRLAPQFVPRQWYRVDALPRTIGGKVRREATRELIERGAGERL